MKNLFKGLIITMLIAGGFISCNDDDDIPSGQGTVTVKLTDDPFPFDFVTEANIGVAKVELKNAIGEYIVVFEGSSSFNMVGLTNGSTKNIVTTNIKKGTYSEARVTLNAASVKLSNGTSFNMNADAQKSYTVRINPALEVEEGDASDVLFDLDINDSFEFNGIWMGDWIPSITNIIGCSFDADFRACDLDRTGKIKGSVTVSGVALENAYVYIKVNNQEIATQTEANGSFAFIGITEGSYTVYVETEANGSTSVANIQVSGTGTASCTLEL
ncbi:MAG: DUF4382 domain-containing protein [Flavobacteriaceae bacterium]|nr:DUF4382 domain-containing protein [Flavobacteriaceae bacterium]